MEVNTTTVNEISLTEKGAYYMSHIYVCVFIVTQKLKKTVL